MFGLRPFNTAIAIIVLELRPENLGSCVFCPHPSVPALSGSVA